MLRMFATLESEELTAGEETQVLIAAKTFLALGNGQVRAVFTQLLDEYGPTKISLD